ncbi:capreomycidine synthase [Streptomyces rapamycinicus]|uniref:Capreomycidine synthase n=1 Tax=Streptomyces rapamycinicus TaxID=1226757 RepID=A0ABR6M0I5_9ACTN|nr:capreomycidine synthase [Streptomyces rapamycinicus]MBB4787159.1 capreomycidine synthase [Streptomyces rapamycinicus]UTO67127.1 capreomycidine synthase [Streptomyces rapamycinicus]UTP35084.1 capreomycidine synthase [Streptomyces rapamycinicus NRRL 5491]
MKRNHCPAISVLDPGVHLSPVRNDGAVTSPPAPPILEEWYRRYLDRAELDISSSGVQPYSFAELRRIAGIGHDELDGIVMDDSTSQGSPELRQAIADRYAGGRREHVMVTHGSSEAIALTLGTLLEPGDRVVLSDSLYHSLGHFARERGCEIRTLPLGELSDGAFPDSVLRDTIGPGTKAVVANFPHNPTGLSLSGTGYRAFLDRVADAGALLVWDAAFAEITHGADPLPNPEMLYPHTVSYGTFSKVYGLPGLRFGWCIAPPELIERTFPLRDRTTLFLSPLVERIALHAVRAAPRLIGPRVEQARHNLELMDRWVERHADVVAWQRPHGGVCGLLELPHVADVERFCLELLDRTGTLLVPGTAFDLPHGVRLGFGGAEKEFAAGLDRLSGFLRGARGGR